MCHARRDRYRRSDGRAWVLCSGRRRRIAVVFNDRAGAGVVGWLGRSNRVSCISAHDPQLARLADAIAQRVGQQRFHVWFNNSTRLDLKQDGLEIAVPNDFISEWIGKNFTRPIQEAAHEVLGCPLQVRFSVVPELFEVESDRNGLDGGNGAGHSNADSRETSTNKTAA